MYISKGPQCHPNVYIQKYNYPQANEAPRYKMGSPAYIQKNTSIHRAPLTVPLEHHRLPLPQAVVAHHHFPLPQVVVVHPLPVPPTLVTIIQSSQHQPLLLVVLQHTMAMEPPHTAPGYLHPGCETTCPQAHPVTPPPGDDVCPQNLLWQPPKECVMAQHQGHQTGVSSLPSLDQLVTPQSPHADVSLPVAVSPAPDEPTLSTTPPHAHEMPHLHIQTRNR
jgi:hypothetical protein